MMKTKLIITIALMTLAAVTAACNRGNEKQGAGELTNARATFLRSCAVCHGADGQGKPLGGLRAPSLKREEAMNYSDEQLFDRIYRGTGNMPSFKNSLKEEEIKGLVRYVREELQGRQKPSS